LRNLKTALADAPACVRVVGSSRAANRRTPADDRVYGIAIAPPRRVAREPAVECDRALRPRSHRLSTIASSPELSPDAPRPDCPKHSSRRMALADALDLERVIAFTR
jgi:hypothetical protein